MAVWNAFGRRVLVAAALATLPLAAPQIAAAETGADPDAAPMARAVGQLMTREQAALDKLAAERIAALAAGRASGAVVTAGARNAVTAGARNAPAARPAAAVPAGRLDFATLDAMPAVSGDAQFQCLAQAVYFESRGEPLSGQIAVAEVVLNRVDDQAFPKTICGVTRQGAGSGRGCQFSYACDGRPDVMTSSVSKARSEKIARMLIDGRPRSVTSGATHFHATYVRPDWSRKFARTASIGNHVFYRQSTRVASN